MNQESTISTSSHAHLHYVKTSSESLGSFKIHTEGIGSKLMKIISFNGQGLGKNDQSIINLIEIKFRPINVGLGYLGGMIEAR